MVEKNYLLSKEILLIDAESGLSINQSARLRKVSQTHIIRILKNPEYEQLANKFKHNGFLRKTKFYELKNKGDVNDQNSNI
jgi:hypothetical protein